MSDEISANRRAHHEYHILERFEAGIELKGTEVKSIRGGYANLNQAFARVERGQVFLYDSDVQPYIRASFEQHVAKRPRKLLLHKAEIAKLFEATAVAGHTLVALRMYWKNGKVKVEIGIAKGKEARDKREDLKTRAIQREMDRAKSSFNRRHA
jgi:SsrA-binding protein